MITKNFFVDFKFEMCVNSKKFLYFAKTFEVKRFYYWGQTNGRYLPFKNPSKTLFTHFENNKKLRCDRRPLNFATLHWPSDNKIVAYCCLELGGYNIHLFRMMTHRPCFFVPNLYTIQELQAERFYLEQAIDRLEKR